jgi:hypothetical protein
VVKPKNDSGGIYPPELILRERQTYLAAASFSHFLIDAALAAPASGLPSLLTALDSQAPEATGAAESFSHFFTKAFFAAPASGLPFLPTALSSQGVANAVLATNNETIAAMIRLRILDPLLFD